MRGAAAGAGSLGFPALGAPPVEDLGSSGGRAGTAGPGDAGNGPAIDLADRPQPVDNLAGSARLQTTTRRGCAMNRALDIVVGPRDEPARGPPAP